MTLFETFERVFVINLPRRKERLDAFFQRIPTNWPFRFPERYTAIDGGLASPPSWWNGGNGAWGCYKAHTRILEDCLSNEIDSVLIFEDDAVCVDGFVEKVQEFWKHLPDNWEMVYLGGQHLEEGVRLPRKVNEWVYQPFNVNRCHCYGFRGRKMIERAYRHLHDFVSWKVAHHVDHYLGELHKRMETGLYVPKEWLVAQSEGKSDICGEQLELRLFPSSVETVFPVIDRVCVAVLGTYFGGTNTLAGSMKELGFFLGKDSTPPEDSNLPHYFEDAYLGEICRNSYAEPWLEEKGPRIDRVNHLRRWAGIQCKALPPEAGTICAKHPILSLMGPEIVEAWPQVKFICIDRPDEKSYEAMQQVPWCWHPSTARYSFDLLRKTREEFFKKCDSPLLRIDYGDLKKSPENTLKAICDFLQHVPSEKQMQDAVQFAAQMKNDYYVKK